MIIFFIIILLIALILFWEIFVVKSVTQMVKPKINTDLEGIERAKKIGVWDFYESLPKEEFWVQSFDNYELYCVFSRQKDFEKNKKIVVISHGHRGMRYMSIKYANMYWNLGYSVLIYDLRGHGMDEPFIVSMGQYESQDLVFLVESLKKRFGPDVEIGLHGESMGAATSILALGKLNFGEVKFCVADCPYSSSRDFINDMLKKKLHMPKVMYHLINLYSKYKYGIDYEKSNVTAVIKETSVPIMLIHGEKDKLISCNHSKKLYDNAKTEKKVLKIVPGAGHAMAMTTAPEDYNGGIKAFLESL